MSGAVVAAGAAGAVAVVGAWELVGAIDDAQVGRRLERVLRPLRAAGTTGRAPTEPEQRRLAATGALVLLAAGWLLAGGLVGAIAAAAGPWLAGRAVALRRFRWQAELAAAAPVVGRTLADALAGGHSVRGALAEAGSGAIDGAAGVELAAAARALALGERTEVVLERLRLRASHPSWDALVAAVLLQREAGGDLAGLLRGLAAAQEDAARVEADARGLTAQARFTARLVAGMPLAAAGLAELTSPGYAASLARSPLSLVLAVMALTLVAIALVATSRIARVRA